MRFSGIDEAGYGPTLGPLTVVSVVVESADAGRVAAAFAASAVRDSKQVHVAGDIAAIESVALPAIAWLTGSVPETAAACFALLGESAADRAATPWMRAAEDLALPAGGSAPPPLRLRGVAPCLLRGHLVQPASYNAALRGGRNKAELELDLVCDLLASCADPDHDQSTTVDRLGGRRYYQSALQATWSSRLVLVEDEADPAASVYRIHHESTCHRVAFRVGGDASDPLTAMASCIAKYVRELHVLLLNRWWCAAVPGLRPTAGYPQDARRWLDELGAERTIDVHDRLVRQERARMALKSG